MRKSNNIVYKRVFARMVALDVCMAEAAQRLAISENSFRRKMRGESPFLLEEAMQLQQYLTMPECMEVAFERCE